VIGGRRPAVVSLLLLSVLCASAAACRTSEAKKVWVMPADLACASDDDCTIRKAELDCCCECYACASTAPFAISKRANADWNARCAGAICTMDACEDPVGRRVEDFRAVCVNQSCERRARR
jgi:hypothetical protein